MAITKLAGQKGFTLIELMVVVVIIALLTAIAVPSYQYFLKKSDVAMAQQELQRIAEQLARHKAKNFNYQGFNLANVYQDGRGTVAASVDVSAQTVQLPIHSSHKTYQVELTGFSYADNNSLVLAKLNSNTSTNLAQGWILRATSNNHSNYSILLTNTEVGVSCMNKDDLTKVKAMNAIQNISDLSCGSSADGAEPW